MIISSDKGYDKVGVFLHDECNNKILITSKSKIADMLATQKKDIPQKNDKQFANNKVDSNKKTKLNQQMQQALSTSNITYRSGVINEVAKMVTSLYGNVRFMNKVNNDNELRSMYPEDYLDVYGDIKPILCKYATDQDKNADGTNKFLLHNNPPCRFQRHK